MWITGDLALLIPGVFLLVRLVRHEEAEAKRVDARLDRARDATRKEVLTMLSSCVPLATLAVIAVLLAGCGAEGLAAPPPRAAAPSGSRRPDRRSSRSSSTPRSSRARTGSCSR